MISDGHSYVVHIELCLWFYHKSLSYV